MEKTFFSSTPSETQEWLLGVYYCIEQLNFAGYTNREVIDAAKHFLLPAGIKKKDFSEIFYHLFGEDKEDRPEWMTGGMLDEVFKVD